MKHLVCFPFLVCFPVSSEIPVSTKYVETDVLVDLTPIHTVAIAIHKQLQTQVRSALKPNKWDMNYFLWAIPTLKHYSDIVSDMPSGSIWKYICQIYTDILSDILSGI